MTVGWVQEGGLWRYLGPDGTPVQGWVEDAGECYWLDDGSRVPAGTLLADSWLEEGGSWYHLGATGAADRGICEVQGVRYAFGPDGAMLTGWVDGPNGQRYWAKQDTGQLATHEWVQIDGLYQAFDDDGSWVTLGDVMPAGEPAPDGLAVRQQAVLRSCEQTPWPGPGLCAGWVSAVFAEAGLEAPWGDACDMARDWCVSSDLAALRPGMIVAVPSHSRTENGRTWGHVGVYVGNGVVCDSGSYAVRHCALGSWLAWFGVDEPVRWGWACGVDLEE